jgi:hypothetical protein
MKAGAAHQGGDLARRSPPPPLLEAVDHDVLKVGTLLDGSTSSIEAVARALRESA